MSSSIKALLAKAWKDEDADLRPGTHYFDEEVVVRLSGTVKKEDDQMVTPTVSVPLIPVLALFWEKCGIAREPAMAMLRESITEAMDQGIKEDGHINSRIDDVNAAIKAVREDLLAKLPKMSRAGRTNTKNLRISVLPLSALEVAA